MNVLVVYGTRPEALKLAPVILEMQEHEGIRPFVCVTAQHREMLDAVNRLFGIEPDFDLDLMAPNQSLDKLAGSILEHLPPILKTVHPDWVLVQGDTTTAMAAALAGYHAKIKVAHVEAGLRSHDKWQPFPEEINRRLIGALADLHFAPTESAKANLINEGISPENIIVTGNTIIDTLKRVTGMPFDPAQILPDTIPDDKKLILVTAHRRENIGAPLENICHAIHDLAQHYSDNHDFVFPVHLNPSIQNTVHKILGDSPNVTLLPPLDYLALTYLLKNCALVMTDSGGLQEEAPYFGKPVLVLRNTSERPEGLEAGISRLAGTDKNRILEEVHRLLDDPAAYRKIAQPTMIYGDGTASPQIINALLAERES